MNNYDIINLRRIQDLSGSIGSTGQVLSSGGLNGYVSWINASSGGGNVDLSSYATTASVESSLELYAPKSGAIFKGDVKFDTLDISSGAKSMSLENIDGTTTFKTDNNGQYPFRFMGQLQNYINNAYENVLTSSSLSSYATTSSLSDYATTASLSSYALLSSLSAYASMTVANTFTALQTFNLGLTVPANQTLTCNGTLAGGTITATTQAIGNNSTNVATTAYVDRGVSLSYLIGPATGTSNTLPAQTVMRVYYQIISGGTLLLTDPINAYIGQTITIHNKSGGSATVGIVSGSGSSIQGQSGNTFQSIATTGNFPNNQMVANVVRTFMFLGSTSNPRWVVLGC
jgi:hypothetical protein